MNLYYYIQVLYDILYINYISGKYDIVTRYHKIDIFIMHYKFIIKIKNYNYIWIKNVTIVYKIK